MSSPLNYPSHLVEQLQARRHRGLVVLEGDADWQHYHLAAFISLYRSPLWLGKAASCFDVPSVTPKKAKAWLGQEVDCLIVDANETFHPDAFGTLSGTVCGGGVLLLLISPQDGDQNNATTGSMKWLRQQMAQSQCLRLCQSDSAESCEQKVNAWLLANVVSEDDNAQQTSQLAWGCVTTEQVTAVEAIRKVVTGHRKRPLVLTADRGRGKSSALGLAAASLMVERKLDIVVTAPSMATVATLFQHAKQLLANSTVLNDDQALGVNEHDLSWQHSRLRFVAPDRLLQDGISCDFLIVDEAAAIPAAQLQQLLKNYNRIAFASTVHGYEGTGRGFAIKFNQYLSQTQPQWRGLHLSQPIRWASRDPLEGWTFSTLMLDAEIADEHPLIELLTQQTISNDDIQVVSLSKQDLLANPKRLSQVFGLLVNAHYQTSPADFFQLLDDQALQVWCMSWHDEVIGCCLVSLEGEFTAELADCVMRGQRRLRGHLLPQSVAAHIGLSLAAQQKAGRIQRIAIHPRLWRRQLGAKLLQAVLRWAQDYKLDYVGTSFGIAPELLAFWRQADFAVIRLGVTKDMASGCHSALAVKPLSVEAHQWYSSASFLFELNFSYQVGEQFSELSPQLALPLLKPALVSLSSTQQQLVKHQLCLYSQGGLGYDQVVGSLAWFTSQLLSRKSGILSDDFYLVTSKVIQRQSWSTIISHYGFSGRKEAESAMRTALTQLLSEW
ncbi:hypothetical protein A3K86_18345 [Photobacterium jeanii]|uniref:tRNA(Met) cytidine acetyltransferase TmcA n=1 Tax=Photobacterium jeanii TaxID=858640 RepID=A0A178K2I2_9GAMM|nr:GNAT family N-acetyltransferase [Photobacterium jeanii]OAN10944.1 hypothetical protein A3K86_18345 [Photobacterium jeanii]PST90460.1 tRNA(Met) cytidine acetyltransferase [Photobacterium jeanii]